MSKFRNLTFFWRYTIMNVYYYFFLLVGVGIGGMVWRMFCGCSFLVTSKLDSCGAFLKSTVLGS